MIKDQERAEEAVKPSRIAPPGVDELTAVLPRNTHIVRGILGGCSWTWTSPDGLWSVDHASWPLSDKRGWSLKGPGGAWHFPLENGLPARLVAVLNTFDAIDRAAVEE
jgi:hypothetical protein